MQHVYTARDSMDVHFVKGLLEQEGITAVIQGEALQDAWGGLPLSTESLPSIWVEDSDVERARPIIEEYKRRDEADAESEVEYDGTKDLHASRPTWTCANCGEKVEEQFTQCWHCGHARPTGGPGATTVA